MAKGCARFYGFPVQIKYLYESAKRLHSFGAVAHDGTVDGVIESVRSNGLDECIIEYGGVNIFTQTTIESFCDIFRLHVKCDVFESCGDSRKIKGRWEYMYANIGNLDLHAAGTTLRVKIDFSENPDIKSGNIVNYLCDANILHIDLYCIYGLEASVIPGGFYFNICAYDLGNAVNFITELCKELGITATYWGCDDDGNPVESVEVGSEVTHATAKQVDKLSLDGGNDGVDNTYRRAVYDCVCKLVEAGYDSFKVLGDLGLSMSEFTAMHQKYGDNS